MDQKTLSERDVEDNNHSHDEGVLLALKAELMACFLIGKRGKI
jgi:hypothetical protein